MAKGGSRAHALALAPALAATWFAYRDAPGTFFAQDDVTFLSRAAGLEPGVSLFRPLSETLAFRLQHAAFGLDPLGYHVVNLALHLVNVAGVYALALALGTGRATAGAAALLFGVSAIAFTPLHWATGIVELLAGALVLAATLVHVAARRSRRDAWRWVAAPLALGACLAKETAVAWLLAIAVIERRSGPVPPRLRALAPALAATAAFVFWFLASGQAARFAGSAAYARADSPLPIAHNLMTYLSWCVALNEPVRDALAAIDPGAWRTGLPVALAAAAWLWARRRRPPRPGEAGVAWLLAFLVPVLPLLHHTYLYYLYIPWMGGSLAAAVAGRDALARLPRRAAAAVALAALAGFAAVEAGNVAARRRLTRDALPVDRTLRDAMLLRHALADLRAAELPPGTPVAFVNPVPRRRFDLVTGVPTRAEDERARTPYLPLEAAMRGGETLRLFAPGLVYRGFATTIPPGWEDAECFHFEQRGWLDRWGRGQAALSRQATLQLAAGRWAEADTSWRRVRALGDTLPEAVWGQRAALAGLGRTREAAALADSFAARWPGDPRARAVSRRSSTAGRRAGSRSPGTRRTRRRRSRS